MINLLKFYLPNIIRNTLLCYLVTIALCGIVMALPITESGSDFFLFVIFYVIFPAYAYFNSSNYISFSLGWILQTPVPKLQIILTNGLINIFKLLFITFLILSSLSLLYLLENDFSDLSKEVSKVIDIFFSTGEGKTSLVDDYQIVYFFSFIIIFLFGILPDLLVKAQETKNNSGSLNLKDWKSKKSTRAFGGVVIVIFTFLILENNSISNFYIYNAGLAGLVLFSIPVTLTSVKYQFGMKYFFVFAALLFTFGSYLSATFGKEQFSDRTIRLDSRIELLQFLESYSGDGQKILVDEMTEGTASSIDIGKKDILDLIRHNPANKLNEIMTEKLIQKCNAQLDHTCRLATYLLQQNIKTKTEPSSVDYLKMGCPKDLSSCTSVAARPSNTAEEKKYFHSVITAQCAARKDQYNQKICDRYMESLTKP